MPREAAAGVTTYRFDQMATLINDRVDNPAESGVERYVGLDHLDSDSLRIRRWGEITDVESTKLRFQPGDIIFGKRRVYQRKLAVADFEGICSAHAMVLRAKENVVLPEFLPFFMQSDRFMERALEISVGSLSPTINWTTLAAEEFALPPIEEQRRMVLLMSAAAESLDTNRALVGLLERLRQASIDDFTAPSGVQTARLGEHCELQNGRPFPGDEYCDEGILLLRPGNLAPTGYFDWDASRTKRVPARYLEEAAAFRVDSGDVVINLTAQSLEDGFMGRVCFARESDRCLLNQRIGRFRSFSKDLLPEFLYRTLQSERFKAHAISMCEGSKIKHLFWQHLDPYIMRLPPMDVQLEIVSKLRDLDQRIADARHRSQQIEILYTKMLKALTGIQRSVYT